MNEKLEKIFMHATYEPETGLEERIWRNVVLRDKQSAKMQMWAFSFLGVFSLAALIPMLKILADNLTQSGFYDYFSLIFSDSGTIVSHFQEFAFTLAESLPVISIILSLCLVFFFFLSIRYTTKQIIRSQLSF